MQVIHAPEPVPDREDSSVSGEKAIQDCVGPSKTHRSEGTRASLFTKERQVAAVAWGLAVLGYWWFTQSRNLSALDIVRWLIEFLAQNPLGLFLYILIYMIRPLFLFPATFVTMAAGYLYGSFTGIVYAIIASNLSSMVAYLIGRYFGDALIERFCQYDLVNRYAPRLRNNSFETSLTLRFMFLPYDLVSYFSGFLKINWRGFLLATMLGSIPGTISFALIGAAFEGEFTTLETAINADLLFGSAVMFVLSIVLSRWFRAREGKRSLN